MASSGPLGKFGMKKLLQISPWVERFADQIPSGGAVLDLACGGGRHSYFFLDREHPVTAIDRDISTLQPRDGLEIIQHNLEDGSAWPIGRAQFAAVVVVNYLHRPLLPRLIGAVGQGGVLVYDTFAIGNEVFGRPSNPDFLLRENELYHAVEGELEVVAYFHGRVDEPNPALRQRICARRC